MSYAKTIKDFRKAFDAIDATAAPEALRWLAADVQEAADGEQDKFDNLPDNFQGGEQGDKIQNRQTALEELASALESAADEIEGAFENLSFDEAEGA